MLVPRFRSRAKKACGAKAPHAGQGVTVAAASPKASACHPTRSVHFLLIAPERVAPEMAAAGIRTVELARSLARRHRVSVAAPTGSSPPGNLERLEIYDPANPASLHHLIAQADAVFAQPLAPRLLAGPIRDRPWVVDLINPQVFEGLEYHKGRRRLARKALEVVRIDRIGWAARTGTTFACGSERQRDMWLGFLAASRRLDTDIYADDPEMRSLIDLVPSGVPAEPPARPPEPVLRGPVFAADSRIVAWNGGLWDWLDPFTVLQALSLLRAEDKRWVLAFGGGRRPSHRPAMKTVDDVRAYVAELSLQDAVHLPDGWTPYSRRADVLLEADVGVSAHRPSLESRFSYRNRLLDCIWAGTPIVCTEGDALAGDVAARGWGETVRARDAKALAAALHRVAGRGRAHYASALGAAARVHTWDAAGAQLEALLSSARELGPRGFEPAATGMRLRHELASRFGRA